jgi:hypothetical protein
VHHISLKEDQIITNTISGEKKQKNHTKETPCGGGLKRQKIQIQLVLLADKLPQHVQDIAVVSSDR